LAYDFVIKHMADSKNLSDGLPGRPDDAISYEWPVVRLRATISVDLYDHLMPAIIGALASNCLAVDLSTKKVNLPASNCADTA